MSDLIPNPSSERRQTPKLPAPTDNVDPSNPIDCWIKQGRWPSHLFEPELERLLAQKRSFTAFGGRRQSDSASSATPSDQKPREEKSTMYRDIRYETLLATKGSFMEESKLGVTDESKKLCKDLLQKEQVFPKDSLFHDDFFQSTCRNIRNRNESRVIQDISRLIVPSAEILAIRGAKHLDILIDSNNQGWNNSRPLTLIRPQPDYSVGFRREAFTKEQHEKLSPFVGEFLTGDLSYFMATYYMYFPFLSSEIQCGGSLDVADRQNAHSMTLAVRGVVELFRLVGREAEVHRQILAFSISHDDQLVHIYGHYPIIDEKKTNYYRHLIRSFCFTGLDGEARWAAYQFTKNVYDIWMPDHFKRITSAIDQIPDDLDFGVQALSESTGLSQSLQNLAPSGADIGAKDIEGQTPL